MKYPPKGQEFDKEMYNLHMGFIEELARRRQLAVQEQIAKREKELERVREEQKRAYEVAEEKRRTDMRIDEAKKKALHSSVVPEMIKELQLVTGFYSGLGIPGVHPNSPSGGRVIVEKSYLKRKRFRGDEETTRMDHFIYIEGQEDGSVVVGPTRLSADDARDPVVVDQALEIAYNSAERTVHIDPSYDKHGPG